MVHTSAAVPANPSWTVVDALVVVAAAFLQSVAFAFLVAGEPQAKNLQLAVAKPAPFASATTAQLSHPALSREQLELAGPRVQAMKLRQLLVPWAPEVLVGMPLKSMTLLTQPGQKADLKTPAQIHLLSLTVMARPVQSHLISCLLAAELLA